MPIWIMYCEGISLPKQRDFLEEITKLQKILDIGLKQSKANKKERMENIPEKEKSLHEVLMEGFREEQKQRELEELEEEND